MMGLFSFKREERILRNKDFISLKLHGKRFYTNNFVVIIKENRKNFTRLGITVSKGIGNSVKRNRIKRLIREFFRLNKHQIPKGYDLMITALKGNNTYDFLKLKEELGNLLLKNDSPFF